MSRPYIVTFAGVPGTGKTPIAFHISYSFGLPIIQMDAIRLEVREDLLVDNNDDEEVREEYLKRSIGRYQELLRKGTCFIDDSSADRSWKQNKGDQFYQLQEYGYDYLIISMDLSKSFIEKLHTANKSVSNEKLNEYYDDHQEFLTLYSNDIGVHITDDTYIDRMKLCESVVSNFIADRTT